MSKDLAYYRALPYSMKVERFEEEADGEVYYRAYYKEIPRIQGIHQERLLAVRLAKELFDSYIEAQLEWGGEIPEPDATRSRKRGGLFKFEGEQESRSGGSEEGTVDVPQVNDPDLKTTSGSGAEHALL